jgi:hypothetical protein
MKKKITEWAVYCGPPNIAAFMAVGIDHNHYSSNIGILLRRGFTTKKAAKENATKMAETNKLWTYIVNPAIHCK